jgi:hypothetical protein
MATETFTIALDNESMTRARSIAAARDMTLEAYLERLVRVATQPPPKENELGPITRSLLGIRPPMTDEDVRQAIDNARMKTYGSGKST